MSFDEEKDHGEEEFELSDDSLPEIDEAFEDELEDEDVDDGAADEDEETEADTFGFGGDEI